MNTWLRRASLRHRKVLGTLAVLAVAVGAPLGATNAAETAPLTLADAERLALTRQPVLEAQGASVRAARERAVAMRQLPDPMLLAGVQNLFDQQGIVSRIPEGPRANAPRMLFGGAEITF